MQRLSADPTQLPPAVDTLLAAQAVIGSDWVACVRHVDQALPPALLKQVAVGDSQQQEGPLPAMLRALAAVQDASQLLLRYRCVGVYI